MKNTLQQHMVTMPILTAIEERKRFFTAAPCRPVATVVRLSATGTIASRPPLSPVGISGRTWPFVPWTTGTLTGRPLPSGPLFPFTFPPKRRVPSLYSGSDRRAAGRQLQLPLPGRRAGARGALGYRTVGQGASHRPGPAATRCQYPAGRAEGRQHQGTGDSPHRPAGAPRRLAGLPALRGPLLPRQPGRSGRGQSAQAPAHAAHRTQPQGWTCPPGGLHTVGCRIHQYAAHAQPRPAGGARRALYLSQPAFGYVILPRSPDFSWFQRFFGCC